MNVHSDQERRPEELGPKAEAILSAALQLFVADGFHNTPVPKIAKTAGVAAGTIYRSFPSKEALVNVLYRRCKRRLMTTLFEDLPIDVAARPLFRRVWFRLATFARRHPLELDFLELHHHASYLDEESQQLEQMSLVPFSAYLEAHATAFKPMPAAAIMAFTLGAFMGLYKAARLGHFELDELLVANAEAAAWAAVQSTKED